MMPQAPVGFTALSLAGALLISSKVSMATDGTARPHATPNEPLTHIERAARDHLFEQMRNASLSDVIGGAFYWQEAEGGSLPILDLYRIIQILAEGTLREFGLDVSLPQEVDWDARPVLQEIKDKLEAKGKVLLYGTEPSADMQRAALLCYAVADVTPLAEIPPLTGISLSGKPFAHTKPVKVYSIGEIVPHRRYAYHYASASGSVLVDELDIRNSCVLINPAEIESNLRRYGLMNPENAREQVKAVMYNELAHFYSMSEMSEVFSPKNFRKTVYVIIKGRRTPITIHQINELYSDLITLQNARPHPAIYFSARMINTRAEDYRLIHIVTASAFSRMLYEIEQPQPDVYKRLFEIGREFKRVDREGGLQDDAEDAILAFAELVEDHPDVSDRLLECAREETEKLFEVCWHEVSVMFDLDHEVGNAK